MAKSIKRVMALLSVICGLCGPLGAQVFDYYELVTWGVNRSGPMKHPRTLRLTLGVPETLLDWNVCLRYYPVSILDPTESRIVADCGLWRDNEEIDSRELRTAPEYYEDEYGAGYTFPCVCLSQPFPNLVKGDVVECEVRFRGLPDVAERGERGISMAVAESEEAWCQH